METQKKVYTVSVTKAPNADARTLRFIASTQDVDRDGDIIDTDAWLLDEWYKNPVIMWGHQYNIPSIAKGVRAEKDIRNSRLIIDARFPTLKELAPEGDPSEHAKFIETVFQLYNNGYLSAVSVGCKYKDAERRVDSDRGYHVKKAELLELSCCPIGANQNALMSAGTIPGVGKEELDMVIKSFTDSEKPKEEPSKVEEKTVEVAEEKPVETKDAEPDEKKEGRRLSKASIALIDEMKLGLTEFDEAIESLKGCRGKMEARIKALENGSSEEPDEEDMGNDDEEKGVVIRFVD